jgi:sugar (pentulose or hexulose) kinase
LENKLPRLISSDQPAGKLSATTAKQLGLNPGVLVSAGGGDNMMGAIGTGNTRAGIVTASFGTSGTIYACSEKPVVDPRGEIAAFCDSTNRWLPLLCTMNVTVATEMMRLDFGYPHEKFEAKAATVPPGSNGLLLLPYLEGERTPNVPDGTGVMIGINPRTFRAGHYCRAAMEGVTLGMNYGLQRLEKLGVKAKQIRATGGGAKSKLWRQIMADIFNAEVVTLKVSEGAAYGAALQALWCWRLQKGEKARIADITNEFVALNTVETVEPEKKNVAIYRELQSIQDELSNSLRGVFARRQKFISSQLAVRDGLKVPA